MAQIVVFGRVMHELVPKEGQSKQQYVCFDLMERSGNNPPDYYQIRCYPAHAAQGQKGKHDLAHRIAKTGGCSPKGRNHSQEAENMADGLWISPRAVLQSKIRKWTA